MEESALQNQEGDSAGAPEFSFFSLFVCFFCFLFLKKEGPLFSWQDPCREGQGRGWDSASIMQTQFFMSEISLRFLSANDSPYLYYSYRFPIIKTYMWICGAGSF